MRSPERSSEAAAEPRRYLIAVGTAHYEKLPEEEQRPEVEDELTLVVDLFTKRLGYELALAHLGLNPRTDDLRRSISEWLLSPERRESDLLVLYYSGHGQTDDGAHYLLAADSDWNNLEGTALPTASLGRMLRRARIQQALLLLDTCYSGAGGRDFLANADHISRAVGLDRSSPRGVYVIAAARAKEEAEMGAFVTALERAVTDSSPKWAGRRAEYLPMEALVEGINRHLGEQHATLGAGRVEGRPQLIPNLRYAPDLPIGVDLQTQRRLAEQRRREMVSHWDPRSRGVEIEVTAGWYFTGREAALRELVRYLNGETEKPRVVTGAPGSGKSAVLARLVTLSGPEYRQRVPLVGVAPETIPAEGSIDVAVHVRHRSLEQVCMAIAAAAGVDETDPALLVHALAERGERLTLVVDALDEAVEAEPIARELLRPLSELRFVRLIVGTRRQYLMALGPGFQALDLDRREYSDLTDLTEYVRRLLLAEGEPERRTPYRGQPELARAVGEAVARRAYPVFLVARLTALALVEAEAPVDIGVAEWQRRFPETVGDAFDKYLDRFGVRKRKVRDLLRPLAYAEGAGLPWENLWAPLASALSGAPYADRDIDWLLSEAGAYVASEDLECGRSVYRLYHEALAEHLRRPCQDAEIQRRVTQTLIGLVPARADGHLDWPTAPAYVRTHLAQHAAAAGMLGKLVQDPLFLAAAGPAGLLPALRESTGIDREVREVYQQVTHLLGDSEPGERLSYLELAARVNGAQRLARRLTECGAARPWNISSLAAQRPSSHRIIARQIHGVLALTMAEREGRPVVVSGSHDGTVRLWDLETGIPLGQPLTGHTGGVRALAVAQREGRFVLVSGNWDGTVLLWDLETSTPLGQPLTGHTGGVTALAVAQRGGHPVVVSGSWDETIRLWDLEIGTPLGQPLTGHTGGVRALAVAQRNGRPVVVSGSHDETVRVWDLETGTPLGQPLTGHTGGVTALAVAQRGGHPVVASGSSDETIRLWDLETGTPLGQPLTGHTRGVRALAVAQRNGRPVVVSGSHDETVRVWDLESDTSLGAPLTGHTGPVTALAVAQREGRPVVVSGGWDKTVRVWDLKSDTSLGAPLTGHTGPVTALAVAQREGRPVVVSGGWDKTVRLWDLESGTPLGTPLTGHAGVVSALAVAQGEGRPVLVSGSHDGTVRLWDLETGIPLGRPLTGQSGMVSALAVAQRNGRPVVVSGSHDETVRVWDLETGTPLGQPLTGHTGGVAALAVAQRGGHPVVVSGSWDETIRLWDLEIGTPLGQPLTGQSGMVSALAVAQREGRPVLVSGSHDGTVRLWDLETGTTLLRIDSILGNCRALAVWRGSGLVAAYDRGLVTYQLR